MLKSQKRKILEKKFFDRSTLTVAQDLLGCFLVRETKGKIVRGRIMETEAYVGEDDLASHASKGRTPRTEIMYGPSGRAYIYLIYGMYYLLNIVTEKKDFPSAVLIRSVEIDGVAKEKTNGPGKVGKIMKISKNLNNWDLTKGEKLWLEAGEKVPKNKIKASKRIGVDYAEHCKDYLWRFLVK